MPDVWRPPFLAALADFAPVALAVDFFAAGRPCAGFAAVFLAAGFAFGFSAALAPVRVFFDGVFAISVPRPVVDRGSP